MEFVCGVVVACGGEGVGLRKYGIDGSFALPFDGFCCGERIVVSGVVKLGTGCGIGALGIGWMGGPRLPMVPR
jgi:hypothetical protein